MSNLPPINNIPHSIEAEEALIGSVLIDGLAFNVAKGIVEPLDFFMLRHQYLWQAFERIHDRGELIDTVTMSADLKAHNCYEDVGGRNYLFDLINKTPTAIYAEMYAHLVQRASLRRKLLKFADGVKVLATDETIPVPDVLSQVYSNWQGVSSKANEARTLTTEQAIDEMVATMKDGNTRHVIPSKWSDLNRLLSGYEDEQLIVKFARTGHGKSLCVANEILSLVTRPEPVPVYVALTEMSIRQFTQRLVRIVIAQHKTRRFSMPKEAFYNPRAYLNAEQIDLLTRAMTYIKGLPIVMDDTPRPTVSHVDSGIMRAIASHGVRMAFVDGGYEMQASKRFSDEYKTAGSIYKDLKVCARTHRIPIVATHQSSRANESRTDKRPYLSDLIGSSEIEAAADVVIGIYRPAAYDEMIENNSLEMYVLKNRDGATGNFILAYDAVGMTLSDAIVERFDLSDL